MIIYSYKIDESMVDDLLPTNNEDGRAFSSMEMEVSSPNVRNKKREARPIFNLILDILDTVYTSTKTDLKRSQNKGSRYTR